ncbi:MAG: type II secretion system protein [Candidatus Paceibacterota bacterium]
MINGQKLKSFTLVETVISIALFGFISVILVNIFVSSIRTQTRILQNQELMEQSSYSLEYMTRLLRMAKKDEDGSCTGTTDANYGIDTNSITFLAYDTLAAEYRCRRFLKDGDVAKEMRSTDATSGNLGTAQAITSSKIKVSGLTFGVTGNVVPDTVQPKVTVMINIKSGDAVGAPEIFLQSSVSQRDLDI